jgi:hypothetical protein
LMTVMAFRSHVRNALGSGADSKWSLWIRTWLGH